MKKISSYLVIFIPLFIGYVIGVNIKIGCAQTNFPICVTPTKYLIWPDFNKNYIPIGSNESGKLKSSGFYISDNKLYFPSIDNQIWGEIYYAKDLITGDYMFYCSKYTKDGLKMEPCGGGAGYPTTTEIWKTDPQTGNIYWEKNGQRILEIGTQ